MPRRFISRTTSSPKRVRPPCCGASVAESAQAVFFGVGDRHVAGARGVELAQGGERVMDRVPPLHADQRGDPAGLVDAHDVVGRAGQLEGVGVALDQAVDVVDLLERRLDGVRAR